MIGHSNVVTLEIEINAKSVAYVPYSAASRDDHYPVCRLDIRKDSEFATGHEYPKTVFKRQPDTDEDIRNTSRF